MPEHLSRYADMVGRLARQAIDSAVDASPHKPRQGQAVYRLIDSLPTARRLLGDDVEPMDAPPTAADVRFLDGFGHTRPVYRCLAFHLHHQAFDAATAPPVIPSSDVAVRLWQQVIGPTPESPDVIDAIAHAHDTSLHAQGLDDGIDFWTYRELVGLHALDLLAQRHDRDDWRRRVHEIALHHTQHTQPDYTTYQPWALVAFSRSDDTASFAEQQLHDVATHLAIEGGGGAVLTALLLADASAEM